MYVSMYESAMSTEIDFYVRQYRSFFGLLSRMSILHHPAYAVIQKGTLLQRKRKLHFAYILDYEDIFFLMKELIIHSQ